MAPHWRSARAAARSSAPGPSGIGWLLCTPQVCGRAPARRLRISFAAPQRRVAERNTLRNMAGNDRRAQHVAVVVAVQDGRWGGEARRARGRPRQRSEEHTSELQSRLHLVCRLLLEKKKKKQKTLIINQKTKLNINNKT